MIDTRDSSLFGTRNPMEGEVRIPSGCAIAGIFHKKGGKIGGDTIIRAMEPMHDRSNGLGGGFAGYGIYPDFADCYAFHMFYDNESARDDCEHYLKRFFDIHSMSVMPTRPMREITDPPIIWRYFVTPKAWRCQEEAMDEDAFTAAHVLHVNVNIPGAFIFSSGKNMGVFKGVGYPEDMGRFFRLEEYAATCWTAHGRYPTNTPGWWGGAGGECREHAGCEKRGELGGQGHDESLFIGVFKPRIPSVSVVGNAYEISPAAKAAWSSP